MDLKQVNDLKKKGNEAFRAGKLSEAIDIYTKAIELVGEADDSLKAILYSNRAQAMLVEKRYAEALADSERSLKCDPSFMKSVLRRATANVNLNNNQKAVKDLREVLKYDPKNLVAKDLMSKVSKPAHMDAKFAGAYIGNYLRRVLTVRNANMAQIGFVLMKKLPRIMFLSAKGGPFLQNILNGSSVSEFSDQHSLMDLSEWFALKGLKANPNNRVLPMILSDRMLKLMLEVFRPNVHLLIATDKCVQRYGSLYKFASVCFTNELMVTANALKVIEESSNILTQLPYLSEIVKFKNKSFPKLNSLFVGKPAVGMEFLKLWKKQKWGVRKLIFNNCCPNLINFENFGGHISKQVVTLHVPFMEENADLLQSRQLSQVKQELVTLKKSFPNLTEVFGKFMFASPSNVFMEYISRTSKHHIVYLATNINDNVKPEWCEKLKILVIFSGKCTLSEITHLDMDLLKSIVDECRREIDCLDHISLHGPSPLLFSWYELSYSPALIKMSTTHADFEIAFKFSSL